MPRPRIHPEKPMLSQEDREIIENFFNRFEICSVWPNDKIPWWERDKKQRTSDLVSYINDLKNNFGNLEIHFQKRVPSKRRLESEGKDLNMENSSHKVHVTNYGQNNNPTSIQMFTNISNSLHIPGIHQFLQDKIDYLEEKNKKSCSEPITDNEISNMKSIIVKSGIMEYPDLYEKLITIEKQRAELKQCKESLAKLEKASMKNTETNESLSILKNYEKQMLDEE